MGSLFGGPKIPKPQITRLPTEGSDAIKASGERLRRAAKARQGRDSTRLVDIGSSGDKLGK